MPPARRRLSCRPVGCGPGFGGESPWCRSDNRSPLLVRVCGGRGLPGSRRRGRARQKKIREKKTGEVQKAGSVFHLSSHYFNSRVWRLWRACTRSACSPSSRVAAYVKLHTQGVSDSSLSSLTHRARERKREKRSERISEWGCRSLALSQTGTGNTPQPNPPHGRPHGGRQAAGGRWRGELEKKGREIPDG